jgi:hypothetical protein
MEECEQRVRNKDVEVVMTKRKIGDRCSSYGFGIRKVGLSQTTEVSSLIVYIVLCIIKGTYNGCQHNSQ